MAYAKVNSVEIGDLAKIGNVAKAALGKIANIDAPEECGDEIPTDGLVGHFLAGTGITLDTSAGRNSVSTWTNQIGASGWDLTQTTKALQPSYDNTGGSELVEFNGTYYLSLPNTILTYNSNWTFIVITDIASMSWGTMLGTSSVWGYLKFMNTASLTYFRMNNFSFWYPPYDSSDSLVTNANFNVVGMGYPGGETGTGPSNIDNYQVIANQYLFKASEDNDPGTASSFTAPADNRWFNTLGNIGDGTRTNAIVQDIKEVLFYNKQLTQCEVTAIYNYANNLVTLNALPADMNYYGS
jgi:hypothetical protein